MTAVTGRRLLAVALFSLLAASAPAQQLAPADVWPQATAALDTGDIQLAQQKLDQLLELGRNLGISRFPLYAQSAASLARQIHHTQPTNKQAIDWAAAAAQKLDPKDPSVAFAIADLAFDRSDWGGAVKALTGGIAKSFAEPTARAMTRADLVTVLAIAILGTAGLLGVALFSRHSRPAAHDFREMFTEKWGLSSTTASVLALAALVLPLFLWLGPTWILVFWYVIFFAYASVSERIAIVVLLVLMSLIPVALDWSVYRVVGSSSPVVRAATSAELAIYHPENVRRMRELVATVPGEAKLQLLLGGLEFQIGDEQQASVHYREAIKLDPKLGGAHVNLGNLDFLHNEFRSAVTNYERAIQATPALAIAYFNIAAASGELYDYARQGQMLEEARKRDRNRVQKLIANPPSMKIVMYTLPVDEAWALSERLVEKGLARELFGNYAQFDPLQSFLNPMTTASLIGIIAGPVLWWNRKKKGLAGSCMKCGRTFCYRCKSARESATYCTQCIHIYLKRDGVSLDTKQAKINEVQKYQNGQVRLKKVLATFFPGSGQIMDGSTTKGLIAVFSFLLFLAIAVFVGSLVPIATPAILIRHTVRVVAILLAVGTWLLISIPVYRQKPVY
ncbi:MAG: tetratricopeptide repeat protein [Thermoanaerobaculia bacterium]|nr:tetratricopeptide repeat protein [Thermoanaerobaculia bacterium]